jgi:hypothetical protein
MADELILERSKKTKSIGISYVIYSQEAVSKEELLPVLGDVIGNTSLKIIKWYPTFETPPYHGRNDVKDGVYLYSQSNPTLEHSSKNIKS